MRFETRNGSASDPKGDSIGFLGGAEREPTGIQNGLHVDPNGMQQARQWNPIASSGCLNQFGSFIHSLSLSLSLSLSRSRSLSVSVSLSLSLSASASASALASQPQQP